MCDACQWPDAVKRMHAAQEVALMGRATGKMGPDIMHGILTLAIVEVQDLQHVSRARMEQLWKFEKALGMDTVRPENPVDEEDDMPRKNKKEVGIQDPELAAAVKEFKDSIPPGTTVELKTMKGKSVTIAGKKDKKPATHLYQMLNGPNGKPMCAGCCQEGKPHEQPPCRDCTTDNPLYDVGEQAPAQGTPCPEPCGCGAPCTKTYPHDIHGCDVHYRDDDPVTHDGGTEEVAPPHDPATGEVPMTDREKAAPAIAAMVQRVVEGIVPRALEAFYETHEPASFTVTCKIIEHPEVIAAVEAEASGKLTVGVPKASGTVSIDDKQTRLNVG